MSKELVNVLIKEVYNKLLKNVGPGGVKNVRVLGSLCRRQNCIINGMGHARITTDIGLGCVVISYSYSYKI